MISFFVVCCRLCIRSCITAMDIRLAAVSSPAMVGEEDLGLVPSPAASCPPKRRRLSAKISVPSVFPFPPPPPPAILPLAALPPPLWEDITETSFEVACHRRKYRVVYNRFQNWYFRGCHLWVELPHCSCTQEIWNLARKDYSCLSQQQKNLFLRYFLRRTEAPQWVSQFSVRQWPCDVNEKKPNLVLRAPSCLMTFHGDWGIIELDANLPQYFDVVQLTEHLREMQEAQSLWQEFLSFSEQLAADLHGL